MRNDQDRAPFVEALEAYRCQHMIPFHTPGHKLGKGASAYQQKLLGAALPLDLGLMYALDDLFQPEGCLKEAMELAADLYGAGRSFFSVNGTTACIEAMLLALSGPGRDVIIPREAHRSVLGGLVLSGASPIYMDSVFAGAEQMTLGPDMDSLQRAIRENPQAGAVLFTYPTYDGVAGQLADMAAYAHAKGLVVLVDEAHGAHLPFHPDLPRPALDCGVDCVAQSTHKLTGSLTQTSMLHCRRGFAGTDRIATAMALVQSTSPNYLFLASLDSARQQLACHGRELVGQALVLARRLRCALNEIDGIYAVGKELLNYAGVSGFDETKVSIDFSRLGLTGQEAELLLRRQGIEVELVSGNRVLALITLGDRANSVRSLWEACRRISLGRPLTDAVSRAEIPLPRPVVAVAPKEAWNAEKEMVLLSRSQGRIAAETVTFYPPGIPILGLGERITAECLAYIGEKMAGGYKPNGATDGALQMIQVLK